MKERIRNILYIVTPLILGSIVGILTKDYIDYNNLIKPPLSPPKLLFPIMWTIIYINMGLAYYIYRKGYNNLNIVKNSHYIQLVVNLLWTIIFFVFKLRFISIIWILLLLILVFNLITLYWKYNRLSAYLTIPYIVWIVFATYLTIGIYILN